jgi:hypothetical protein
MIIPCPQAGLAILINVYFRRLKINHDSREFILQSSTVANKNYVHFIPLFLATKQSTLQHPATLLRLGMVSKSDPV